MRGVDVHPGHHHPLAVGPILCLVSLLALAVPLPARSGTLAPDSPPEFLAAGDFDADGHQDLVAGMRGERSLTLLLADGAGDFRPAETLPLPGAPTALAAADVNRPDGLPEILVAVDDPAGPALLVFESPLGAARATPERIPLAEPAVEIAAALVNSRGRVDVVARGTETSTVVEGRNRRLSWGDPALPPVPPPLTATVDASRMEPALPRNDDEPGITAAVAAATVTLTVNSTDDVGDADPGNGVCETLPGGGTCTLRAAIEETNALLTEHVVIEFDIPGDPPYLIVLGSALPDVTETVTIDGTTQPGFAGTPLIRVSTNQQDFDGLVLTGGSSVVRGLMLIDVGGDAIVLRTNGGNTVEGNYIGTDGTGSLNFGDGVLVDGVAGNTIGGTTAGAGNLISGNVFGAGVRILGAGATNNLVQGNRIGLRDDDAGGLGNGEGGVRIEDAPGNTIGGATAAARNVVSGNISVGGVILIGSGTTGNLVQGNYIGTDPTGSTPIGNNRGVIVDDMAAGNTIGGTGSGAGNLISGNGSGGGILSSAADTVIQGNTIGTDPSGTEVVANTGKGIEVSKADNVIGGTVAGAGNLISGNHSHGVHLRSSLSTGNVVQGNLIGTDATGTAAPTGDPVLEPFGNGLDGVFIDLDATASLIGGADPAAANTIAFNAKDGVHMDRTFTSAETGNRVEGNQIFSQGDDGVSLTVTAGVGNAITANSLHDNGDLGIDLNDDGVTANDAGDGDGGANSLQNFPVLTSAVTGSSVTVEGTLDSAPSTLFTVELFANPSCDPSGHGEGELFLGGGGVTTDGAGQGSFSISVPTTPDEGSAITATATDPDGNTSELSACVTLTGPCGHPSNLELTDRSVTGSEEFIACDSILAHSGFEVGGTGDVTLRAGGSVALGDGFSVATGGELVVIVDPALAAE